LGPVWTNSLQDPISKITKAKGTGGVAQAAEHMLCKCEALSSNPSSTPSKKTNMDQSKLIQSDQSTVFRGLG
jgi:hypothetical protein